MFGWSWWWSTSGIYIIDSPADWIYWNCLTMTTYVSVSQLSIYGECYVFVIRIVCCDKPSLFLWFMFNFFLKYLSFLHSFFFSYLFLIVIGFLNNVLFVWVLFLVLFILSLDELYWLKMMLTYDLRCFFVFYFFRNDSTLFIFLL